MMKMRIESDISCQINDSRWVIQDVVKLLRLHPVLLFDEKRVGGAAYLVISKSLQIAKRKRQIR